MHRTWPSCSRTSRVSKCCSGPWKASENSMRTIGSPAPTRATASRKRPRIPGTGISARLRPTMSVGLWLRKKSVSSRARHEITRPAASTTKNRSGSACSRPRSSVLACSNSSEDSSSERSSSSRSFSCLR